MDVSPTLSVSLLPYLDVVENFHSLQSLASPQIKASKLDIRPLSILSILHLNANSEIGKTIYRFFTFWYLKQILDKNVLTVSDNIAAAFSFRPSSSSALPPSVLKSSCFSTGSPSQKATDTHIRLFREQLSGIPQIRKCHRLLRQRSGESRTCGMTHHSWLSRRFRCSDLLRLKRPLCFPDRYRAAVTWPHVPEAHLHFRVVELQNQVPRNWDVGTEKRPFENQRQKWDAEVWSKHTANINLALRVQFTFLTLGAKHSFGPRRIIFFWGGG